MLGNLLSKYMIKQLTSDKVPTVYTEKCMNSRQRRQYCEECVKACPSKALEYKKGIHLSKEKCTNCNLCAAICPSVTFVPMMETLEPLYRKVHNQNVITVGCEQAESEATIKVGCIGELPWEFLAYVALDKQLVLDLSHCIQCEKDVMKTLVENNLKRLEVFLPNELYEQNVTLSYKKETQIANQLTRREMFTYLAGQGKSSVAKAAPFLFPKNEDARVYRTLLVGKVKQLNQEEKKKYGWNSLLVTTSCYGCKTCEKLCPQEAIKIVNEDGAHYFTHNYAKCTHCGICKTVCNQDAIRFSYSKKDGKRIITACEITVRNCIICNDPIPESEDGLCIICRKKKNRGMR